MARLGARPVPVVAQGDGFVFAQVIADVIEFLGLDDDPAPDLPPDELIRRYEVIFETALRLTRQMPDEKLVEVLPNRPRSWRELMHHVFQIPTAFLEMEETGAALTYERLTAPPPDEMVTGAAIAAFGETVRARFDAWATAAPAADFSALVPTYFGTTSRHEMLERTVWHTAQHVRQLASLLEQAGLQPDCPLGPEQIQGLPLTDKVWDEV